MGMFDCIHFDCPNCGSTVEGQTKSGPCVLDHFSHRSVPVDVAIDANRHAPHICGDCGSEWVFGNVPDETTKVALTIEKAKTK